LNLYFAKIKLGLNIERFVRKHDIVTIADALRPGNFTRSLEKGHKRFDVDKTKQALDSLTSWGVAIKGHYLIHGDMEGLPEVAAYLTDGSDASFEIAKQVLLYKVKRVYPNVTSWDFLNHPHKYKWNRITAVRLKNLFTAIKTAYPNITLGVNEGGGLSSSEIKRFRIYQENLTLFTSVGLNFDFIGEMSHFKLNDPISNDTLTRRLLALSKFGKPIMITEFDVLYGELNELSRNEAKDKMQAAQCKRYLKTLSENTHVKGITSWGFWEVEHWYPNAAYFNAEFESTKNGKVYLEFLNNRVKK
jgi:GH35 family endo-1,4-beta-xylanase